MWVSAASITTTTLVRSSTWHMGLEKAPSAMRQCCFPAMGV
jgi:hypothetical protein